MTPTLRQTIGALLAKNKSSARELSAILGLTPGEVEQHLAHLAKSQKATFKMTPARCRDCGFVFSSRSRLDKPGRCPACKGQRIAGPWFDISD